MVLSPKLPSIQKVTQRRNRPRSRPPSTSRRDVAKAVSDVLIVVGGRCDFLLLSRLCRTVFCVSHFNSGRCFCHV